MDMNELNTVAAPEPELVYETDEQLLDEAENLAMAVGLLAEVLPILAYWSDPRLGKKILSIDRNVMFDLAARIKEYFTELEGEDVIEGGV